MVGEESKDDVRDKGIAGNGTESGMDGRGFGHVIHIGPLLPFPGPI